MIYENIGICYHGLNPEAGDLARAIADRIGPDHTVATANQDELDINPDALSGSDLVITIGGDGTILRGVHVAAPRGLPVLGVNMGRVGFMSDIDSGDALDRIDWYLDGHARVEEREMVRAEVVGSGLPPLDALNDITIARGHQLRVIDVSTVVDGVHFATFRGDGVVVATATGSTGYALSLGGPVMDPMSRDYLVKPIATHMSQFGGVVIKSTSTLEFTVTARTPATLNADGFMDVDLASGQTVRVSHSPHRARFLRSQRPSAFWGSLSMRLGIRKGALPGTEQDPGESNTI